MHFQKVSEFGIFIAACNILVYCFAFLNMLAALLFQNFTGTEKKDEENADNRYNVYLTLYKTLLLIFSLIMVITSINLLRGIVKKSFALVKSWLILSFCVLAYQVIFLSEQLLFCIAYGHTNHSPLVLLGLFVLFGLQIFSIRKIIIFSMDLIRSNILQTENVSTINNSSFDSHNYIKNLIEKDPSIFAPLTEEELRNQYKNTKSANLNNFEI